MSRHFLALLALLALLNSGAHGLATLQIRKIATVAKKTSIVLPKATDSGTGVVLSAKLISRRSLLAVAPTVAALSVVQPAQAAAPQKKVVVFGGAGYVGAHVQKLLAKEGVTVVSVSRSSADAQAAKTAKILGTPVAGVSYESLDASSADLASVLAGATAVVSCVGALPGSKEQRNGNGAVNVRLAEAAKAAGVPRLVYISVGSAIANGPGKFLFGEYVKGKAEAEAAVSSGFGAANALVIKPDIIAGGPPGELRPPGPPGVPAVSVEAVASAAVAGALGRTSGVVDGAMAIEKAGDVA